MSALKLVEDIHAAGGTLELTDGKLIARSIPAGMLKQLRSVKPEVMALLAVNDEESSPVITGNHVAGSDGTSCVFRTNEGAVEYAALIAQGVGHAEAFSQSADFENVLLALAACGWSGESVVNVARAIADGVTDEAMLTSMLGATHD